MEKRIIKIVQHENGIDYIAMLSDGTWQIVTGYKVHELIMEIIA